MQRGGAAICGQGGVGKTALALVIANQFAAKFPDAQIYLDLQGVSERPVATSEAMAHVVRAFHPDAKLPEGPLLEALYRDTLSGQRALLLMDNAKDLAQVAPLVPPAGCALLVTSRQRFTLPGLVLRDLDVLPEGEAATLLRGIAPRVGDAAERIAALCGYLPFALRVAGSTLVERRDLTVAEYEKRLGSEKEKAKLGEAALGLSYTLLPEALQQRYRELAVFAGDFDAEAARAVWALDESAADEALGAFVARNLLDGNEGRYKLHDLARAFAGTKLGEEEREKVELRHAEHYRRVLSRADDLFLEGNEHVLEGLALFDREQHQVVAGQAWARKKLQVRKEAARLASEYPNAGAYVINLRLAPRQQIVWLESGLEGARQTENRTAEGNHLGNLGVAYKNLGETRRAIEFHEQHLTITREIGERRGEGNALGNLGNAYARLGETRRAIEFYEQQLTITRKIGDRRGEGNALGNLGNAYADLGETRRAIEFHEQCLTITREIGDRRGEGIASWNLGLAYEKEGDLFRAISNMEVCVAYERELDHPDAEKDAARVEAIRARLAAESPR